MYNIFTDLHCISRGLMFSGQRAGAGKVRRSVMEVMTVRLWVGKCLALGPFGLNWVLDLIGTWLGLGVQRGFGARA